MKCRLSHKGKTAAKQASVRYGTSRTVGSKKQRQRKELIYSVFVLLNKEIFIHLLTAGYKIHNTNLPAL